MARVEKTISDDLADAAIDELFVRAGQRPPSGPNGWRWASEGPRRVRDLDTLRDWITNKPSA